MSGVALLYTASIVITIWGVAHVLPTRPVIAGFEPLTPDNRRVLTMEWVAEGMTLCFIGVLTLLATLLLESGAPGATLVYRASAGMLLVMAIWTLATGARTAVVMFKICPMIKTGVAALLLSGSF